MIVGGLGGRSCCTRPHPLKHVRPHGIPDDRLNSINSSQSSESTIFPLRELPFSLILFGSGSCVLSLSF